MPPLKKRIIKAVSILAALTIIFTFFPSVTDITKSSSNSYANLVMLPNNGGDTMSQPALIEEEDMKFVRNIKLYIAALTQPNGLKDIEDAAYNPIGVIQITEPNPNIRTDADPSDDSNIAWVANQWEKYVVIDTTTYGETTWYEILKRGTIDETYYVSSVVSSPVVGNTTDVPETVEDEVTDMVKAYFKARKMAYQAADFAPIEAYIKPETRLAKAQKEWITNPPDKVTDYEIVNIFTSENGRLFVRVLEANLDVTSSGEVQHLYYLHDYLIEDNEQGDYQFAEEVNTYSVAQ